MYGEVPERRVLYVSGGLRTAVAVTVTATATVLTQQLQPVAVVKYRCDMASGVCTLGR